MNITPAALKALVEGDIDNFKVASTPGGIEAQEKAGQLELVASSNMPLELLPNQESFEVLGFKFGEKIDDVFQNATLPEGWSKKESDHDMWSSIVDEKGCDRVEVFYKAAFYDRRASARIIKDVE